jgi:hypothetical protein
MSNIKSMLICFSFSTHGIAHTEIIPPGQTVNTEFYPDVLRHLRENMRRKHADK